MGAQGGQAASGSRGAGTTRLATGQATVVDLRDKGALDPAVAGAKAAALARAADAGLPVLPGFVLTTAATARNAATAAADDGPGLDAQTRRHLEAAWAELSQGGTRPVIVRSSSTVEDGGSSSMAGLFVSVPNVRGRAAFLEAVEAVLASSNAVNWASGAPMAVLVQPQLEARVGGVLFGADPVTGRTDRLLLAATEGTPERLVSGEVDGAQYELSRRGRCLRAEGPLAALGHRELRALARLASRSARVFGGPQDVEWAFDAGGGLRLLQSRPITAAAAVAHPRAPVYGPGPVAETFPAALSPLEEDLWVAPLRSALTEALRLAGAASSRRLGATPVLVTVGGRVAVDLALLGEDLPRRGLLARLDPRPPARRLRASWAVGKLRAAMPDLGAALVADVDRQLLEVGPLAEHDDAALVDLLRRSHQVLVALHGHEVLAGLLVTAGASATATTAASVALRALAEGRAAGLSDDEIAVRSPAVLALVPPRVGLPLVLPPIPPAEVLAACTVDAPSASADDPAVLREALRVRARWAHELTGRVAGELGARLAARGVLADAADIRQCRVDELPALAAGVVPIQLEERSMRASEPLPAAFRLSPAGEVVEVRRDAAGGAAGRAAGGGRVTGTVHDGVGMPAPGAVLVVRTLDPALAAALPHVGGLVAETGSVLSHLAVLARELSIPTVVAVPDAVRRFPPGTEVTLDGSTGEVVAVGAAPATAAVIALDRPDEDGICAEGDCPAAAFAGGLVATTGGVA